jgi:hypothetical protein
MLEIAHGRMVWADIAVAQGDHALAMEQLKQAAGQYKESELDDLYHRAEQALKNLSSN